MVSQVPQKFNKTASRLSLKLPSQTPAAQNFPVETVRLNLFQKYKTSPLNTRTPNILLEISTPKTLRNHKYTDNYPKQQVYTEIHLSTNPSSSENSDKPTVLADEI